MGAEYYCSTDIWSMACLTFELATGDYLFDPHAGKSYTRDEDHLGHIMELLGGIPEELLNRSKYKARYFMVDGSLKSIPHLKPWTMRSVLVEKYDWAGDRADDLTTFLLPMLNFDPLARISAADCMKSAWLEEPLESNEAYERVQILN